MPEGHSEVEVDDSHLTYAGLGARDRHYVTYSSINVATAELNIDARTPATRSHDATLETLPKRLSFHWRRLIFLFRSCFARARF